MPETQNTKEFNLGDRTFRFAQQAMRYFKNPPPIPDNIEITKQGIRAAGSVGANYIEAEEALGRKDFVLRIKIVRKEAKEAIYWLRLSEPSGEQVKEKDTLIREATELMKIFGSIVEKSK
jgi:four helix bundle protein